MACDHQWTIRFHEVNRMAGGRLEFEVRPITMNLKQSRTEYDFCRAKLPWEVGEMMKPHTRYEGGAMYDLKPVDLCYNGDPIQRLMFRPDWVDYGSEFTHLQLHDLQKSLADGTIDIQRNTVKLEDIYTEVINSASNDIIEEIRFTVPDSTVRTLVGKNGTRGRQGYNERRSVKDSDTQRLVDSDYAVDFDQISPERAIARLNKRYRLRSWVNREGVLIVGLPEANAIRHIAAAKDERVWRYKDPSISHGREPIKKVIVEGAWVDEPGFEIDPRDWFDQGGTDDVRAMGVAVRQDIDYGSTFSVKASKAKRDALPHVAKLALEERMKQQNAGSVEIDPELSGEEVSEVIDLVPGDYLHLVPEDRYFDKPGADSGVVGDPPDNPEEVCGGFINNEAYLVNEVEHNITEQGEWQATADIGMVPDVEITSYMNYFNPEADEWIDQDEIAGEDDDRDAGALKGGLFESI